MKIDRDIKQALNEDASHLDEILLQEPGLFRRIGHSFNSGMRYWLFLVYALALISAAVYVYCGYNFATAPELDDRIFWGIWFIFSFIIHITLKLWTFMEMNRTSTMREVKRIELAVEKLQTLIEKDRS